MSPTWSSGQPSLVIDACVAKSASTTEKPRSRQAREVLDAVTRCRIPVLFTASITDEWERHASTYSTRWRVMMMSRGLAISRKDKKSSLLRKTVALVLTDPADVAALLKDIHLLEAALAYASRVVSGDDRSGRLANKVAEQFEALQRIQWVSPHDDSLACCQWIRSGLVDVEFGRLVGQDTAANRRRVPRQSRVTNGVRVAEDPN